MSSSPRAEILASQAEEPAGLLTWEVEVARKKNLVARPFNLNVTDLGLIW